ncbi:factor-independent urate hydroxylase [Psychromicrobium xiongbiense]|uniref:factor-independent urate hydroxylase n=1 Tax=Psychromicrobium xiongbiense TaxID=3051184 RepID=UPI002552AB38|nr:urate oxidase [Psychromicrobium sp. YIM S02556]
MGYLLGDHQYGKAETRLVRIYRDAPRHEIRDVNVTTALRGAFDEAYLTGDQSAVLPTDTQKNTAYAFAKEHGLGSIEDFGLTLARHFVDDVAPVTGARIEIEEYSWQRATVDGVEHDHTWLRTGPEVRTAAITIEGKGVDQRAQVIGGVKDLVILKSTGSEFAGFLKDEYTTLPETHDRVMATSIVAKWRFSSVDVDWEAAYTSIRAVMVKEFATLQSLALQQTLWHMGTAVLDAHPEVAEIRLVAPNKHHFLIDFSPFGLENPGEVFFAADRPYGLIEATILREDAPDAGEAWHASAGLA